MRAMRGRVIAVAAVTAVPVRTLGGLQVLTGTSGWIDSRIGTFPPIRLALDTGFTGLVLVPGAGKSRPAGVQVSSTVTSVPFVCTTSDSRSSGA